MIFSPGVWVVSPSEGYGLTTQQSAVEVPDSGMGLGGWVQRQLGAGLIDRPVLPQRRTRVARRAVRVRRNSPIPSVAVPACAAPVARVGTGPGGAGPARTAAVVGCGPRVVAPAGEAPPAHRSPGCGATPPQVAGRGHPTNT